MHPSLVLGLLGPNRLKRAIKILFYPSQPASSPFPPARVVIFIEDLIHCHRPVKDEEAPNENPPIEDRGSVCDSPLLPLCFRLPQAPQAHRPSPCDPETRARSTGCASRPYRGRPRKLVRNPLSRASRRRWRDLRYGNSGGRPSRVALQYLAARD